MSAISQYVEMVPTAGGPRVAGATVKSGVALQAVIPKQIEGLIKKRGGSDATKLAEVVTSAAYGAPQHKILPSRQADRLHSRSALSAAVSASAAGGHCVWLGVILAVTTLAALVAAARRHRS